VGWIGGGASGGILIGTHMCNQRGIQNKEKHKEEEEYETKEYETREI
jgi:hypothetical protein